MIMGTVSQAVQTQANKPTLIQVVQRMQPEIARALPKGMDADRMARLALTVIRQTPALAGCSAESFAGALLTAAALGLEPGVNGEAYLVPYRGECTLIVGYQGYTKLFWQHPLARHIDAQAVHEKDAFDYAYGLDPFLTHKPAEGERGKVTHYYAVAALTTGAKTFVVLTVDDVKKLRGGKTGSNGGIPDPMHWMERKTAIRQLVKMLPKSTTLTTALEVDERNGSALSAHKIPEQVAAGESVPALGAGEHIDQETGEVTYDQPPVEGDVVDGDGWPPAAQPGGAE